MLTVLSLNSIESLPPAFALTLYGLCMGSVWGLYGNFMGGQVYLIANINYSLAIGRHIDGKLGLM